MNKYPLTIELVPQSSWYKNVRSNVTKEEWDILRKETYKKAGYKCEICGQKGKEQGYKHDLECHEIFEYNDILHIQKLIKLVALCPNCHTVKHSGLAQMKGKEKLVKIWLMNINNITLEEAEYYLNTCFLRWKERNKYEWKLDLSILT